MDSGVMLAFYDWYRIGGVAQIKSVSLEYYSTVVTDRQPTTSDRRCSAASNQRYPFLLRIAAIVPVCLAVLYLSGKQRQTLMGVIIEPFLSS